jgi:hypothetical protein
MSYAILLALAGIAVGVWIKQFSFNPAVLAAGNVEDQKTGTGAGTPAGAGPSEGTATAAEAPGWMPPLLQPLSAPESFTPDNLYDKIDGKADLYLAAGFVKLNCRRFALKAAPDQWLEWSVYDMGTLPHAFSVFTVQRRAEAEPLSLTQYAYKTPNSLYFVCGSNYVEAVAAEASPPLMEAVADMAGRFIAANPATPSGGAPLWQLALFPAENLVPGSHVLQTADVFGYDQFTNVFTAEYRIGGTKVLAFVTACADGDRAKALSAGYRAFLLENGGKEVPTEPGATLGKAIQIMDGLEMVFSEGKFVAGVHSAPAAGPAQQVAGRLRQKLSQSSQ